MRVRYSPRAFADREAIFEYLNQRSPSGARNVMAGICAAVTQVSDQPHSGYATDESGVRVMHLTRYPYKIFYRVLNDNIELLHIRHAARQRWESGQ